MGMYRVQGLRNRLNPKARAPLTMYMGARALGTGLRTHTRTNLRPWRVKPPRQAPTGPPCDTVFPLKHFFFDEYPNH